MSKCPFCDEPVYVSVKHSNMTGEVYVRLDSYYCPMCGRLRNDEKRLPENYNFEVGM